MRVTNSNVSNIKQFIIKFQSPICGSQTTFTFDMRGISGICFNPLYAGHKLLNPENNNKDYSRLNPLYAGHKLNAFQGLIFHKAKFQSPICGSQTRKEKL